MKRRRKRSPIAESTLLRDTPWLLPLDSTKPLRVLLVALSSDADPNPGETIEPEIRRAWTRSRCCARTPCMPRLAR